MDNCDQCTYDFNSPVQCNTCLGDSKFFTDDESGITTCRCDWVKYLNSQNPFNR